MTDEEQIRALVDRWMKATAAGDIDRVLELMDEDVVFLGPGRPLMRGRDTFAKASRSMEGKVRFEGVSDIQEIKVFGDWAYLWNQLTVTTYPVDGTTPTRRSGPVLSVLRKQNGRWAIYRDANMIT
ncbi:MAG TPA: SgcJ/EcaC family oxidoreductase [Vicinamibacterales bacterium]|nr:SgcJ/EcaC family oxidoreductase [Vicinamibacterales bacterium]